MSSSPQQATPTPIAVNKTELSLGPTLIRRRQEIVIQLLTSGRPHLEHLEQAIQHDLADVDVQYRKLPAISARSWRLSPLVAVIALLLLVIGTTADVFQVKGLVTDPRVSLTPDYGSAGAKIRIHGENYDNRDFVTIRLDDHSGNPAKEVGAVQADGRGSFETEVTVPSGLARGRVEMSLSARASPYVYKDFYITG